MFDLLHNALVRLGQSDAPTGAVLAYFQWRLLRHVGLMGELKNCVSCGRAVAEEARMSAQATAAGVQPSRLNAARYAIVVPGGLWSHRSTYSIWPRASPRALEAQKH